MIGENRDGMVLVARAARETSLRSSSPVSIGTFFIPWFGGKGGGLGGGRYGGRPEWG